MKTWITEKEHGLLLNLYIQPGASKNMIAGEYGEPARLKIKIKSPPVDGAANEELINFLSQLFGLSKSQIHLVRGETSRQKDIFLENSGHKSFEKDKIINNLTK